MTSRIPPRARYRASLAAVRVRLGVLGLRCRLARAHPRQRVDNAIGIASAAAVLVPLSPFIGVYLIAQRFPAACGLALAGFAGYVGTYYSGVADISDKILTGWPRLVVHTVMPIAIFAWMALAADMLKDMQRARRSDAAEGRRLPRLVD